MRPASLEWVTCEACSDIPLCTLCGKDLLADLEVEDPRSTVASNLNSNFPHTVFGLIGRSLPISVHSVGVLCVCGEGGGGGSLCCIWAFKALTIPNPSLPCKFQLCSLSTKKSVIAWKSVDQTKAVRTQLLGSRSPRLHHFLEQNLESGLQVPKALAPETKL